MVDWPFGAGRWIDASVFSSRAKGIGAEEGDHIQGIRCCGDRPPGFLEPHSGTYELTLQGVPSSGGGSGTSTKLNSTLA